MIEKELVELFSNLDKSEKRNQVSLELEKLNMLLESLHNKYGIEKLPSDIHTYNKATCENMSDEQFYELMYENIIFLRKKVLTFVNVLLKELTEDQKN